MLWNKTQPASPAAAPPLPVLSSEDIEHIVDKAIQTHWKRVEDIIMHELQSLPDLLVERLSLEWPTPTNQVPPSMFLSMQKDTMKPLGDCDSEGEERLIRREPQKGAKQWTKDQTHCNDQEALQPFERRNPQMVKENQIGTGLFPVCAGQELHEKDCPFASQSQHVSYLRSTSHTDLGKAFTPTGAGSHSRKSSPHAKAVWESYSSNEHSCPPPGSNGVSRGVWGYKLDSHEDRLAHRRESGGGVWKMMQPSFHDEDDPSGGCLPHAWNSLPSEDRLLHQASVFTPVSREISPAGTHPQTPSASLMWA